MNKGITKRIYLQTISSLATIFEPGFNISFVLILFRLFLRLKLIMINHNHDKDLKDFDVKIIPESKCLNISIKEKLATMKGEVTCRIHVYIY